MSNYRVESGETNAISTMEKTVCEHCGTVFTKKRAWARFDTDRCRKAHHRLTEAKTVIAKNLVTVAEAASLKGVSHSTIRKRAQRGQIRSELFLGRVMIYRCDIVCDREGSFTNDPFLSSKDKEVIA